MRRVHFAAIGIIAVIALVAIAFAAFANSDDNAQFAAIEQRIASGVEARDADAVMANYVPGDSLMVFDLIPPREYDGWEAYKKDWQGIFDSCSGPISMKITDLKVVSDGKLAIGHSLQHFACTDSKGNKISMVMRTTDGYRKSAGKWLIFHEHNSVPVDLVTAKADMSSKP
jgi:ketosteroid isomerase-like protein